MRLALPMILACSAAGLTACATTRDAWTEVTTTEATRPAPAVAAPMIAVDDDAHVKALAPSGKLIDRALQIFVGRRAAARNQPRTTTAYLAAWDDVLAAIDDACTQAPLANDLGAFVRARITLEVELDVDQRRRVLLPSDVAEHMRKTLASVDEGVAELRLAQAPGTLLPAGRLHEGALVLRAPVAPIVVTSEFGVRNDPIIHTRRFHAGVDLGAPQGTTVYASGPGIVIYAGWQGGFGKHVVIDHGDGIRTQYSHLSELHVQAGQIVEDGDTVGSVGSTGRSTGPHLHFAVTNASGQFLDPLSVLDIAIIPAEDDVTEPPPTLAQAPASPLAHAR